MATLSCPNCGYKQLGGAKCQKCSTLFVYHQPVDQPATTPEAPVWDPGVSLGRKSSPGPFRRVYRVARWACLAVLVMVIILLLRQAPAPEIPYDREAKSRLDAKLTALETDVRTGQPHRLRLDEAELNSFLGENLALKRDEDLATPPPPAAPVPPAASAPGPPEAAQSVPSLEEVQSTVRDVKITMQDDRVQAYVLFDFHGKDLSLILEGRLRVAGGYLHFDPVSGKLGSLPLPQSTLENAVGRMLDSPENREKFRVLPEINDIRIENGELVVAYR